MILSYYCVIVDLLSLDIHIYSGLGRAAQGGETALMRAIRVEHCNNIDVVALLVEKGVDVNKFSRVDKRRYCGRGLPWTTQQKMLMRLQ